MDVGVADFAPVLKSWADDQGSDCTTDWQTVAEQLLLTGHGEPVGWKPGFAWKGTYRWAACVREAGTEHHLYAGLVPVGALARSPKDVALKATSLFDAVCASRLRVGGKRVRMTAEGELHVRGSSSGRTLKPRSGYWRLARDRKTLQEAIPLFIVGLGGWVRQAAQPERQTLSLLASDAGVIASIMLVAFGILVVIKRLGVQVDERWEATAWPE